MGEAWTPGGVTKLRQTSQKDTRTRDREGTDQKGLIPEIESVCILGSSESTVHWSAYDAMKWVRLYPEDSNPMDTF